MNKHLLSIVLVLTTIGTTFSQTCPGDVIVLEDENLSVWDIESNETQIFSLAEFQGTIDIGGNVYFQDDFGFDARGLVLMAHDLAGGLLWSQQIPGTSFFTTKPALTASADNVFVSATSIENNNTEHHFKVVQYSAPDGTPGWSNNYVIPVTSSNLPFGAQLNSHEAIIDATGRLIITGAYSGTVTIGAQTLTTTAGLSETFVMAVDQVTGNDLWAVQSTGSNGRSRAWTMGITPSDEIVIGGHFTGSISFGGTPFTSTDDTTINPYIAKLDPATGVELWIRGFEGGTPGSFNNIYDVDFDPTGNIYYVGSFNDTIDVQGNLINSGATGAGSTDALIGSMDANGVFRWANQVGGASVNDEFGTTINYSSNTTSLFAGLQLATDDLHYSNASVGLPSTHGHFVLSLGTDGSIDPNAANSITKENTFGYSAIYDDAGDIMIMADLSYNNGRNVNIASWVPNRPKPFVDVTLGDGVLNPTDTLRAFDPGLSYTFQWYRDGAPLGGEVNASYVANTNGEYHVEVTNSGGCAIPSKSIFVLDGSSLESDSLVLVELFNNTDGNNWNNRTNWLVGNIDTWHGVTVSGGRVAELFLANNNLNGNLTASLVNLQALEIIDLSGNSISGNLPVQFWDIPTLRTVQLCCGNSISGTIPSTVGILPLETIDLGGNNFTGNLPVELFNITSLHFINLWDDGDNGMNLTGSIPSTIGNLVLLEALVVNGNNLSGAIPAELGSLANLQYFEARNNQLSGSVPTELGNLNLILLGLEGNQLSGTLPDEIWQIPTLEELRVGFNPNLEVVLPSNLASLTQLIDIRIAGTVPIGGPFPTEFYSLTNLVGLDLGGHQFTGSLDANVANWTNLDNLYLWNNQLEGAFPTEITTLSNLRAMSIAGNRFTSLPDLSALSSLEELEISYNLLGFKDIVPNLGVPTGFFTYAPQNRKPSDYFTVDAGGDLNLVNDYTGAGNVYQWIRNQTDTIATSRDYTITGATFSDLGSYFSIITNPSVPDLTIYSQSYNVALSGDPRSWTVDNAEGSVADFKTFYAATYGTNAGDTLYVMGSDTPYNIGYNLYEKQRVIYGPGYFLAENPKTQASSKTAQVEAIGFKKGAEGSEVYGLDITQLLLNNQASAINDTLRDISIIGNRVNDLSLNDDNQNITISKNFINTFSFASTPTLGTSRSYQDIFIENNIIDTVTTIFTKATAARNVMENVIFNRNTIDIFTDSIQDVTLTDNIINDDQGTANSVSGTIGFGAANFTNASGTLTIDNDFIPTDPNLSAGAFSGNEQGLYVLSGLAPIPHIYTLNNTGRIRLFTEVKNESNADITTLRYRLGESGSVVEKGKVQRLEAGQDISLTFRPKLGNVTPGGNIDVMIWAQDANGFKSVPQRLSFVAETTTATGSIFTADNQPVTNGKVLLFEINQEGSAFDTLNTSLNDQGNFSFNNIVIGDYLALAEANASDFPGHLPTYYEQIDLWEEADTLLIDTDNPAFNITLIAEPKDPTGNGMISGFVEEEIEEGSGDDSGRVLARRRVGRSGVSMRRRVRAGRPEEDTFELVEFVFTNNNGEFLFENLPADDYRINIQYPGYPMDTLSDIDLTVRENADNAFELEALVDEGKISVTILSTTGLIDEVIERVSVYPNPTTTEGINILFTREADLNDIINIQMFDIQGNKLINKKINTKTLNEERTIQLPFEGVGTGTYLLKLSGASGEIGTVKLIIR